MNPVEQVLAHYGVKGMKWGIRRTDAELAVSSPVSKNYSADYAAYKAARAKPAHSLSNNEMQALITRMNLEQQYARLANTQPVNNSRTARVGRFVGSLLLDIGKEQTTRVAKTAAAIQVEKALVRTGNKDIASRLNPGSKKKK